VRELNEHLTYSNDEDFTRDCKKYFPKANAAKILDEIKLEMIRRKERFNKVEINRQSFLKERNCLSVKDLMIGSKISEKYKDIFRIPVYDSNTCDNIMKTLGKLKNSGLPYSKVNSMIQHGVLLNEVGLEALVKSLLPTVESLSKQLFPDLVGESGLDSYKAFTIEYNSDVKNHQIDLGTHFDNAEITLNIPLTEGHDGGELYFVRDDKMLPVEHEKGMGILHAGYEMHGAMPLLSGSRTNLIIWFRSSSIRNKECPMCGQTPDLELIQCGDSTGDGFSL